MMSVERDEHEVHLFLLCIDRLRARVEALLRVLAEDERARVRRFRSPADRERYAVGRAALRYCIGAHTGQRPEQVRFVYGTHGKPRLSSGQGSSPVFFNASGSKGFAAIAIGRGAELGVDIECRRRLSDWRGITARFFHERERSALAAVPDEHGEAAFLRLWTLKEAVVKFTGQGLCQGLSSFAVTADPQSAPRLVHWSRVEIGTSPPGHLWTARPTAETFVSVAGGGSRINVVTGELPEALGPAGLELGGPARDGADC